VPLRLPPAHGQSQVLVLRGEAGAWSGRRSPRAVDGWCQQVIHGSLLSRQDDASGQGFPVGWLAGGGDLAVECLEGGDVDLGEGGEGLDDIA